MTKLAKKKPSKARVKNPGIIVPRILVALGECKEIELEDGKIIACKGYTLCSGLAAGNYIYCIAFDTFEKTKGKIPKDGLRLYKRWHQYDAESAKLGRFNETGLIEIGRARNIVYRSRKWSKRKTGYVHLFDRPPIVFKNKKGLIVLKGYSILITERGIEG
jgi:hypothetical protein